jgi:uncharacterized membrane protein
MPSRTVLILGASLVLNAVLLGLVVGREAGLRAPAAKMEFERYGPTSDVVRAAWSQLPESDRTDLTGQIRELLVAMRPDRKKLHEAGKDVYAAALAEPFDEAGLRDSLVLFQHQERMMQSRLEDLLIRHLDKMPPDARATAAVGLLTPFNARMQRVDIGQSEAKAMGVELRPGGVAQPPAPQAAPVEGSPQKPPS